MCFAIEILSARVLGEVSFPHADGKLTFNFVDLLFDNQLHL